MVEAFIHEPESENYEKESYYTSILLGLDSIATEALDAHKRVSDLVSISESGFSNNKIDDQIKEVLESVRRNVEWILYDPIDSQGEI